MLLNGVPFNHNLFSNLNAYFGIAISGTLLEALRALPSGFEERNTHINAIRYSNAEAKSLNNDGMAAFNKKDLKSASKAFNKAAEKSAEFGDKPALANSLSNYGQAVNNLGKKLEAKQALERAVAIHQELGHYDHLYRDAGELHDVLQVMLENKIGDPLKIQEELTDVRKLALYAMKHRNGEPVNLNAIRVEQNEIGFSGTRPIGTANVCDCICLIVRDPKTFKTAVAHVDRGSDIQSLTDIFDRMPKDTLLEARLVGSCYGDKKKWDGTRFHDSSVANLQKITDFLKEKNVNILSADIYNAEQPRSVVVNPATFEVTEEIPDLYNPDEYIATSLSGSHGGRMHIAFDLTQAEERAPHLIDRWQKREIDKSADKIYQRLKDFGYNKSQLAASVEQKMICKQAYDEAHNNIMEILDQKIEKMKQDGFILPPSLRHDAYINILGLSIHIGVNADKFNQPLTDFIKNKLFTRENDGSYQTNLDALKNWSFPDKPYTVIENDLSVKIKNSAPKKILEPI